MLEQNTLAYTKLKLNMDIPDLDENWLDGYESAQHEHPEEANPYQLGTAEYQQWNEGWWAGFFNEEKIFDWDDQNSQVEVNDIIARVQQAATAPVAKKKLFSILTSHRAKLILSHCIQAAAAVLALGICYQFADLFA
ncbi:MAG: hypothetical protein ACK4PR_08320 [Gammaproteobacteria bacterium]